MRLVIVIKHPNYLNSLAKFGVGGAHPGGLDLTKEILLSENISPSFEILDVGCGTGQTAAFIASYYKAKVTGIDINPTMIRKAKKRMKKHYLPVEIHQSSIENSQFEDCTFDLILSESVLAFVNSPTALQEIYRLLKNGGRFIAIEPTINHNINQYNKKEIQQFYGFDALPTENEWIHLLKQANFKNIQMRMSQQSITQNYIIPELQYSAHIEPEHFMIMSQHFYMMTKYRGILDYRIFACSK